MLTFYRAADSETLLFQLADVLKNQPLKNVFAPEHFLVANAGQERWLSQQLAQKFQVFANYQFWQPEQFFRQLAHKIDNGLHNPEFDSELMLWRIDSLLRNLDDDIFAPLKQYCHANPMKRYQLAGELARLFQNYQLFRPELLDDWSTNLSLYSWQQALWQKITAQTGTQHQGKLWQQAIEKLQNAPEKAFKYQLPERLFVFGINHLPPLWLNF
jgi:exodeoxyribonuclease V gamma subunit